jgi:hypothetical protein
MSDDTVRLTREAFTRFWFRYCEADRERLLLHAQTDSRAATELDRLMAEIAEHWAALVQECDREPLVPTIHERFAAIAAEAYAEHLKAKTEPK